jgi:hypothetical protein
VGYTHTFPGVCLLRPITGQMRGGANSDHSDKPAARFRLLAGAAAEPELACDDHPLDL